MASQQGEGDDSLRGLLFLSGMDTSAFNRPQSLVDMKSKVKQVTPLQATARGTPSPTPGSAPRGISAKPASSPLQPVMQPQQNPTGPDPLSLDHLDVLLSKSASRGSLGVGRSPSVSSLASTTAGSTAGRTDDLDLLFSAPAPTAAPAAAQHAPAATAPVHADPLDFLGVSQPLQPSQPSTSQRTAAAAGDMGDLLGGFMFSPAPATSTGPAPGATPRQNGGPQLAASKGPASFLQEQPHPVAAPEPLGASLASDGFGDFLGPAAVPCPESPNSKVSRPAQGHGQPSPARMRTTPAPPAAGIAPMFSSPAGPSPAVQRTWQQSGMEPAPRQMASPAMSAPPAAPRRTAFDYLDSHAEEEQGHARSRPAGAASYYSGHSDSGEPGYDLGNAPGSASRMSDHAKAAAEVKQKAAKMLQAGTQWFMRAGKTLVKDLQGTMGKPQHGGQHGGEGSAAGSTPPYYYDWAAQLARLSPGSRSSALGAMAEEDRLVVQRILDEAALGDTYMDGGHSGPGTDPARRPGSDGAQRSVGNSRQSEALSSPQPRCTAAGAGAGAAAIGSSGMAARQDTSPPRAASQQSRHVQGSQRPVDAARSRTQEPMTDSGRPADLPPASTPRVSGEPSGADSARHGPMVAPAAASAGSTGSVEDKGAAHADLLGFAGRPAPRAAVPPTPPAAPAAAEGDLFSFGDGAAAGAATPAAGAPAAAADGGMEDLLGMHGSPSPEAAGVSPSPARHHDIENLFTVPTAPRGGSSSSSSAASRPGAPSGSGRPAAAAARPVGRPPAKSAFDSMIDMGGDLPAVDVTEHAALYDDGEDVEDPNEPEIRKVLRQRRVQEKHRRMQQQLVEKRAREEAETAEKAGKVELRVQLKPKIDAWAAGKKDNIRALLSSLHTVLWEGSGWTAPNMSDMVENHKVKRIYMKANLIVHPDKVKQKGGTLEQITIADMVFDVLKVAWGKFEGSS